MYMKSAYATSDEEMPAVTRHAYGGNIGGKTKGQALEGARNNGVRENEVREKVRHLPTMRQALLGTHGMVATKYSEGDRRDEKKMRTGQ